MICLYTVDIERILHGYKGISFIDCRHEFPSERSRVDILQFIFKYFRKFVNIILWFGRPETIERDLYFDGLKTKPIL